LLVVLVFTFSSLFYGGTIALILEQFFFCSKFCWLALFWMPFILSLAFGALISFHGSLA